MGSTHPFHGFEEYMAPGDKLQGIIMFVFPVAR